MVFSKTNNPLGSDQSSCDNEWSKRTFKASIAENYFETLIMCIIAVYGFYVLHKLVMRRRFWDFIAIAVPFIIVSYAIMTVLLYWTCDWHDLDQHY